jgi:hypothetical protein
MTQGKFAVSDFASTSVIWDHQAATVEAFVYADLPKCNVILLRAEFRAAFSVLLPAGVGVGEFASVADSLSGSTACAELT